MERIGDLCTGVYDGPHATPTKTETGPVFLGISALANGRLDLSSPAHLSEADFITWTRRVTPRPDDVVFSYETRLGEAALIPAGLRCCLGRRMALMRPDRTKVEPRFLLYAYLGPQFQETLRRNVIRGATVDRIPLKRFPSFEIRIPSLDEQKRIARALSAFDKKIEHNRILATKLARLGQLRFDGARRGWSSNATLADIAAPFRSPTRNSEDGGLPYIGLDNMPQGSSVLTEWLEADVAPQGAALRFSADDILFGKLRPYFKKVGVAPIDGRCSSEILVLRPNTSEMWATVLGYATSDGFIDHCDAVSTGTKMPRAEWKDAGDFRITLPTTEEAKTLDVETRRFYNLIRSLTFESRHLARARDLLLAPLVSAELELPQTYLSNSPPDDAVSDQAG